MHYGNTCIVDCGFSEKKIAVLYPILLLTIFSCTLSSTPTVENNKKILKAALEIPGKNLCKDKWVYLFYLYH